MITILQKNTGQKNLAAKTIVTKREGFAGFEILDLILTFFMEKASWTKL